MNVSKSKKRAIMKKAIAASCGPMKKGSKSKSKY